jgi:hypothetical protein
MNELVRRLSGERWDWEMDLMLRNISTEPLKVYIGYLKESNLKKLHLKIFYKNFSLFSIRLATVYIPIIY